MFKRKKEVFVAMIAGVGHTSICVGFCERVLDVRGIDFVCRTCAHCGEDDEYDWEKSIIRFVVMLAIHRQTFS